MGFHQLDGRSRIPCLAVGTGYGLNLAPLTWGSDAFAAPVRRATNASNNAEDFVPVSNGVSESLEHQHTGSFAHDEAVGSRVKRTGLRW